MYIWGIVTNVGVRSRLLLGADSASVWLLKVIPNISFFRRMKFQKNAFPCIARYIASKIAQ
jgi:hypothetical protein